MKTEAMIRPCTMDDLDRLLHIGRTTYEHTFAPMNTEENMQAYLKTAFRRDKIQGELEDPGTRFFFAFRENEVVGYLKINFPPSQTDVRDPQSLEVERLYVIPLCKGRGIGRALLEFAMEKAQENGFRYVWLGVWEHNTRARDFYSKLGFEEMGRHDFMMGDDCQTDLILKKEVG